MEGVETTELYTEQKVIDSLFLKRAVKLDFYGADNVLAEGDKHLLLINDGQDLVTMDFRSVYDGLASTDKIKPLVCVGIHCGAERRQEYGTHALTDYAGRGNKAHLYNLFVLKELLPFVYKELGSNWKTISFAGFSLGALTALDTVWHFPQIFSIAGIFSGSLWWRSKDQNDTDFDEKEHRIMHKLIREGRYNSGQRFYFTTGSLDETADRNANGIIDSIDDTLALIEELKAKGYTDKDISYINFDDGRHDVATWARALPHFLVWGWGINVPEEGAEIVGESC